MRERAEQALEVRCLDPCFAPPAVADRQIACADRRPVDPPPVVELRIFEGESTKTDITLSYNASFFLFATLEVARPIANGRMHPCPSIPVLTGCPVAAANYLDRPSPAAYFLFPDLSVRHEGWYRLSFNLYEATKEAEDFDIDRPAKQPEVETITAQQPSHNQESIPWRLEVKSNPFQVYSAKKFPGLSESTEISRIVADQGCRVRIRRDIRMRKRNSSKDDYDAHDDGIRSNDQYATSESVYQPQTPIDCRQSPNGSVGGNHYGPDPYYRGSLSESTSSHTIQSARPSTGQSGTFFTAPPQPVNTAKNDVSTSTASPYAPIMTGPRDFAVPLPPVRLHERPSVEPAKAYLPQPPKTAAPPHSLVAEDVQPPSRSNMHLPALLTTTQRPQGSGTVYDPTRRQWNLPEATASKRSHSPRSDHPQQALKQGMRPDKVPVPRSQPSDTIEADNDPYEENDQLDLCANGFMEYRRACGRSHRKRVPNLLA